MSKEKRQGLVRRLYNARKAADKGICPCDDAFRERYPGLWELCTVNWLDTTHRVDTASVQITNAQGDWCFKVNSPAMKASKSVLVKEWAAGLDALEKAIWDESIPWVFWLRKRVAVREVKEEKNGIADEGPIV